MLPHSVNWAWGRELPPATHSQQLSTVTRQVNHACAYPPSSGVPRLGSTLLRAT